MKVSLKFVLTGLMMIQRIHLWNYTQSDAGASAEQIAEEQRQSEISIHKMMTMIVSLMTLMCHLNLSIIV